MPSNCAVDKHFDDFIRQLIESGRYSSASEIVSDALRLLEEREEQRKTQIQNLSRQLQEGRESGLGISADKILDRLEAKYLELSNEH